MRLVTLAAALVLCCAWTVGQTDGLTESQPAAFTPPALDRLPTVDRVVVRKAERRLQLMHGGNIVRSYQVALGLNPEGQKERAGDFRTPEGTTAWTGATRAATSSCRSRCPTPTTRISAVHATRHWDTGGSIMIHGLPNVLKHEQEYYESHDWTDGCVAVSNADMVEIWMLVPDDVPIDILP